MLLLLVISCSVRRASVSSAYVYESHMSCACIFEVIRGLGIQKTEFL